MYVFDITGGSAAAAIGAHYANIQYDGICCNPLHKTWCDSVMNKAMFAVVAEGGGNATDDDIKQVLQFFGPAVDEGKRMIRATEMGAQGAEKKGDEPEAEDGGDGNDDGEDEFGEA